MCKYFMGTTPEIGVGACVPTKTHVIKCVGYIKFRDMFSNNVVNHTRDSVEMVYYIQHQKDLVTYCVNKCTPKLSGNRPEKSSVEEIILKEEIKEYIARKRNILSTVNKIFALVWGKFSDSLQTTIILNS